MKQYILGNPKDFFEFVNTLNSKMKIGLLTHADLDGIASGIFLQKILESRGLNLDFIELFNYDLEQLSKLGEKIFDVLFITDCNIDNYANELEILREEGKVFVIDHHPSNPDLKNTLRIIKTNSKYCSSHCLFDLAKDGKYFNIEEFKWLVCSSIITDYCFDDKENLEFLKSIYPSISKENVLTSEPAIIGNKIAYSLMYYKPNYKKVYDFVLRKDLISLDKISEEIEKEIEEGKKKFMQEAEYFPDKGLYFGYFTTKHRITSLIANKLIERLDKTLVFVSDSEKKGRVKIASRNTTGKIDLNQILKKCANGLEEAQVGGHPQAAGGELLKKDLNKFKERLLKEL